MKYEIDGYTLDVVITKKRNKNTYIRMKDEKTIYVTTSYFVTKKDIERILIDNENFIRKSLKQMLSKLDKQENFYYLGKPYEIVIIPTIDHIIMEDDKIVARSEKALEKWLEEHIKEMFKLHYDHIYDIIEEDIEKPTLKIRKMKTRWGVCNKKSKTITLNSELIKYDMECLDYVIIHEFSHLIYFDHSKNFWSQVSKYCPNYKEITKKLKM